MRSFRWIFALVASFLVVSGTAALLRADDKGDETRALLHSVTPENTHSGGEVVAYGVHLNKRYVSELYLTNGKDDVQVEVTKQTENAITFKVPAGITGRYRLMILTGGIEPKLVEQPVRIVIE